MRNIDVVIPAYGNLDITSRCAQSVLLLAPNARVILVDNGSDKTSAKDDLTCLGPMLRGLGHDFIRLETNCGPYGAVNAGMALCDKDLAAVVCNDVVLLPGALDKLIEAVTDEHPSVGACEVQSAQYDMAAAIQAVAQANLPRGYAPGVFFSCQVFRRALLDEVGLWDTRYRLTYGDTDWEQRYADTGRTHIRRVDAVVFHGASVTRKRLGIEADLRVDSADYQAFIQRWAHRPDVLKQHPPEDPNLKRQFLEQEWRRVGHL